MTRTVSATITTAIAQETTRPIYLIRMAWATEVRAATWDQTVTWNSETWVASGLSVSNLTSSGGTLTMPNGDTDPWLALVMGEIPRTRVIQIYEHQTDYTASPNVSDAVEIFYGYMDQAVIGSSISVSLIESATKKGFPPGSIDRPTYTWLLSSGTRLQWGNDVVIVG